MDNLNFIISEIVREYMEVSAAESVEFPSDEVLDQLRIFDGHERRVMSDALSRFAGDLMQMLYMLNIAGPELRSRMQRCEIVKDNYVLHLLPELRGHHVLPVFH